MLPADVPTSPATPTHRGMTPREVAHLLRVNADRVRGWIRSGELPAVNVAGARCGRPRFIVLPHQLEQFTHGRAAAQPKPARRRKRTVPVDYYPD